MTERDDRREAAAGSFEEEEQRRQDLARYRALIAALPHGVQEIDPHGIITFANPAHDRLFGVGDGGLIGTSALELVSPGAERAELEGYLALLLREQPPPVPWRCVNITKDGRRIHVQVDWDYKRDARGEVVGFASVITDVSARKEAEESLRWEAAVNFAVAQLSKALISPEYEASSAAALVLGLALELVRCEEGYAGEIEARTGALVAQSFVGAGADDCPRKTSEGPNLPRGADGLYPGLWGHALNAGKGFFTNDPGSHPAARSLPEHHPPIRQFLSVPAQYLGRTVGQIALANKAEGFQERDLQAVSSLADLYALAIHRERSECDAAELEARMRQAQKLESLGVLAGGIAHDFNNLLMGVLGYADLALMQLSPDAPAREHVRHIEVAAQRAAELTNKMLAYSGRGQFMVETLDLNRLVQEASQLLPLVISKKAALRLDLGKDLPLVRVDANQLRQVVLNLITNASEALGDTAGSILVQTGALKADRQYLDKMFLVEGLPVGWYVLLDVSDTGCGMDEATRLRIFDPFFTTKFTGRGLGLPAVLGIVRGHKGALRVWSEPGKGTAIRVLLPAEAPGAPVGPRVDAGEKAPAGALVLVADDEPAVREVTRAMLEAHGFRVLTAEDGREAVELYREKRDQVDVLLLDASMPRLGGEEAFHEVRGLQPDARVILTSGYREEEAAKRLEGLGLAGFIQKPYRSRDLVETIRRVLGGGAKG